jgi:hypothetical protein
MQRRKTTVATVWKWSRRHYHEAIYLLVSIHAVSSLLFSATVFVDALVVCPEKNLTFFHIPKTAGWSIQGLLKKMDVDPLSALRQERKSLPNTMLHM